MAILAERQITVQDRNGTIDIVPSSSPPSGVYISVLGLPESWNYAGLIFLIETVNLGAGDIHYAFREISTRPGTTIYTGPTDFPGYIIRFRPVSYIEPCTLRIEGQPVLNDPPDAPYFALGQDLFQVEPNGFSGNNQTSYQAQDDLMLARFVNIPAGYYRVTVSNGDPGTVVEFYMSGVFVGATTLDSQGGVIVVTGQPSVGNLDVVQPGNLSRADVFIVKMNPLP